MAYAWSQLLAPKRPPAPANVASRVNRLRPPKLVGLASAALTARINLPVAAALLANAAAWAAR